MSTNSLLPPGWLEQYDPQSGRNFYVDTKTTPPRVTWYHPYEDEEYLTQHPDARSQAREMSFQPPAGPGPGMSRRRSFGGTSSTPIADPAINDSRPPHKRGFMEKLKDKALSSLEARDERRSQAPGVPAYGSYGGPLPQAGYPPPHGQQGYYSQQQYAPSAPQVQYQPSSMPSTGRRRGGMLGPLLGGLAGGMLLEDAIDHHERNELLQDESLYNNGFDGGGFGNDMGGGFGF